MPLMLLAKMEDDTGFIITLGVVLLAVICWLVLGQDQTIRLEDAEETTPDTGEFRQKLMQRLDRTNDLLTSIRNSALIFIVLMAWRLDEWASLPTSIIVMFANSVYIVALTAFLMGPVSYTHLRAHET